MLWYLVIVALIAAVVLAWFWRTHGRAADVSQGSAEPRTERGDDGRA